MIRVETVGDSCVVDSGPAFKSADFLGEGEGIRLLRGENIEPGSLRWVKTRTWPESMLSGYETLLVDEGDLILGMDRPIVASGLKLARVAADDLPALLVQRVARIRPKSVDGRYLYYWLSAPDFSNHLKQSATGTQLPHVTMRDVRDFPLPRFGVDEERRIVEILDDHLSRLDAARDGLVRQLARLDILRLSRMQAAREAIVHSGAKVHPIKEIAETTLGKMLDAKRVAGIPSPYLRNINVRWGYIDTSDVSEVRLTEEERSRFALRSGDLLVCEGGEPGRCAVWPGSEALMTYQKALHRVRVREDIVKPEFLALMLEYVIRSGQADALFTGTTIKHLPQEKLRQIEVPVPTLEVQSRIIADTDKFDVCVRRLRSQLTTAVRRADALRRSLLSTAFSGGLTGLARDIEREEGMAGA